MEIGLVKRSFRLHGGGERQVGYLITGLLAAGHGVHLFSEAAPPPEPLDGVTYHTRPALPLPRAFRALGFALTVRAALRRTNLTVVQSFERTLGQQIYRAGEGVHREWVQRKRRDRGALARSRPYFSLFDHMLLALERRVLHNTPLVMTNAQRGQREIVRHYGIPPSRLRTIYNGVDLERFNQALRRRLRDAQRAAWGISNDELVLISVGSGFWRKGLDLTLAALAQLRRQGIQHIRLVVIGKGQVAPYQRLAQRLGVGEMVHFEGYRADVEGCYAGADVLVLPTRYDPFANVCLEAMACGLPVLTSAANGASELLRNGVNGLVVDEVPSIDQMASALLDLLPGERRLALGIEAQRTAAEFPLSRMLAETMQLYQAVATASVLVPTGQDDGAQQFDSRRVVARGPRQTTHST